MFEKVYKMFSLVDIQLKSVFRKQVAQCFTVGFVDEYDDVQKLAAQKVRLWCRQVPLTPQIIVQGVRQWWRYGSHRVEDSTEGDMCQSTLYA